LQTVKRIETQPITDEAAQNEIARVADEAPADRVLLEQPRKRSDIHVAEVNVPNENQHATVRPRNSSIRKINHFIAKFLLLGQINDSINGLQGKTMILPCPSSFQLLVPSSILECNGWSKRSLKVTHNI
jgi:hypothetical protein